MNTGGLSPAAWTRVTVRAAETMRYEVATRPPEARDLQNNNPVERVSEGALARFDPGAIAMSAAEQTQTAHAVSRRKQANLKSLPKEGEDDELPGARGRRAAGRGGAPRSYAMDAEGNLQAFGGGDAGAFLGQGESEEPIFKSPSQLAAQASEEGKTNLRTSSSLQAMAGLAAAAEWESHTLTREQKQRERAIRSGILSGNVAMDDPALLAQSRPGQGTVGAGEALPRPAAPSLFPPAKRNTDPYFVRQEIGSDSMFRPSEEERVSLFEIPDGQSIFQTEERESLFDIGEVDPIFDPLGTGGAKVVTKTPSTGADEAQMLVEKEVMLAMENKVLEPVRRLEPALLATKVTQRYR